MKNKDFIYNFCKGNFDENKVYRCNNLTIKDGRLFSYNTCIAEYEADYTNSVIINMTKYSSTTSRHQNLMMQYFNEYRHGLSWIVYDDVPINTINLSRYDYDKMRERQSKSS